MNTAIQILRVETLAARIEGALLADAALARLWRTEVSLVEAAASVGLEGERVSAAGLVARLVRGTALEDETRSCEMARRLLAIIKRPGDIFADPVAMIRRIEEAASPVGRVRDESDILADAELLGVIENARSWSDLPVMAGWRAAAAYAFRSRRESPAAERLIFMAVEARARAGRDYVRPTARPGVGEHLPEDAVLLPAEAGWILAPSIALTRTGFRIWAPLSGLGTFLQASAGCLFHDLGHLGTLRHELARLDQMRAAARGRSRIVDLVEQLKVQPIINSSMAIDRLGVTRKTALSLISELEAAGCLVNLTARRAARFWALPSLAKRMASGIGTTVRAAPQRPGFAAAPGRPEPHDLEVGRDRLKDSFDAERLDKIMAELDAALEGLDDVVRNLGHAARRQERPGTGPAGVE